MQLTVIDSLQGIRDLYDYLLDKDFVAYDCETNGIHFGCSVAGFSVCAEEDKAFYVIIHRWFDNAFSDLGKENFYECKRIIELLSKKRLICHNAVFDCRVAEDYFKVRLIDSIHTDTMILAHLLNENRRVGLKELSKEYFGVDSTKEAEEMKASVLANGGKLTKDHYEMYKCDPYILGKYGAKDALLTYKLFYELVPELFNQGLDKFFYEDESMPLLRGPTYELNTVGLKVDETGLTTLKKTLEAECEEDKAFIYAEINTRIKDKYPNGGFNIGSNQQLAWLLFGAYGLEFNTLTQSGKDVCKKLGLRLPYTISAKRDFIYQCQMAYEKKYALTLQGIINGKTIKAKYIKEPWAYIQVDKRTLQKIAPKLKWVERLLDFQKKRKLLSTYVEGIEARIQYGIIRPSFLQHGTTSGRYASRDPNFQNLPRDDKRIKSVVTSRPTKCFVGADYSQLEPRVFAYYSNDERLLRAFDGTSDFYSVIGMGVYEKSDCVPQKDGSSEAFGVKYKRLRDSSKVIALASTYGATARQLQHATGKGIEDTQRDIDAYFGAFPKVKEMMLDSHRIAKEQGQVVNLFGRPRRMPEAKKIKKLYGNTPHADLPYEARNLMNLAVNHRIQSTGASIVNRAAIKFHNDCKEIGLGCRLVLQVHDSLVVECNEEDSENVSLLLQNAMENVVDLKSVKLEAIPKIGKNLAEV